MKISRKGKNADMMNLSIAEIEKACGGRLVLKNAAGDQKVDSVVLDSRKVTEQGVFAATVGEKVDGHSFISQVYGKGACLVITQKTPEQVEQEHHIPVESWNSYLLVEDTLQALKAIAEYYRSRLNIPVVGITGSVGKTSTKEFVAAVLAEKYRVLKTEGNFNNEIGVPLTILCIRPEHEAAVIEMGISDFGEMSRLGKMVRPDICVITNIGQCHMETLKSRDGILRAKTEIFEYMNPEGHVCLNGEDDKLVSITEVYGKKPHFFGMGGSHEQEVYITDVESRGLWGSDAVLHMHSLEAPADVAIHVPLPGAHMVINSAAAACVGGLFRLTKEQIREGIAKTEAVGGRNHLIRGTHYTLIDDCYNASPMAVHAAIDLLSLADTGRAVILGDMFDLGDNTCQMHAGIGTHAAQTGIEYILCVGELAHNIYEAAHGAAGEGQKVFYFAGKRELFDALEADRESLLPEGITVLIKASHGMEFGEVVEYLKALEQKE